MSEKRQLDITRSRILQIVPMSDMMWMVDRFTVCPAMALVEISGTWAGESFEEVRVVLPLHEDLSVVLPSQCTDGSHYTVNFFGDDSFFLSRADALELPHVAM